LHLKTEPFEIRRSKSYAVARLTLIQFQRPVYYNSPPPPTRAARGAGGRINSPHIYHYANSRKSAVNCQLRTHNLVDEFAKMGVYTGLILRVRSLLSSSGTAPNSSSSSTLKKHVKSRSTPRHIPPSLLTTADECGANETVRLSSWGLFRFTMARCLTSVSDLALPKPTSAIQLPMDIGSMSITPRLSPHPAFSAVTMATEPGSHRPSLTSRSQHAIVEPERQAFLSAKSASPVRSNDRQVHPSNW